MRTLILALATLIVPSGLALADGEPPAHLFDDLNGNGIPDTEEQAPSGDEVDGGAEITDPGDGDGSVG